MSPLIFVVSLSFFIKTATGFFQNDTKIGHHRMEVINFNLDYVKNLKISMVPLNRTERALNGSFDLVTDLEGKLTLSMEAFRFASNEYRLFPFRLGIDVCKILRESTFGLGDIKQFSNIGFCPIKKGSYYIHKYRPDESKFPPHMVPGDYKMVGNITHASVKLAEFHWYGSVKPVEKLIWI